jgi:gliding motility-associated-like protein
MTKKDKHITTIVIRKTDSYMKSLVFLFLILLFMQSESLVAQVITNNGAAISVSSVVVVETKDIENNTGTLGNDGTLNMEGYFLNGGTTSGNGFYNLKGDWTDNGSFNPGTSTVTLNGLSDQTIHHGSSGEAFFNLTVNNSGRIITQMAGAGSSLGVQNDLNLNASTLSLHQSTSYLNIGGIATISGNLLYNSVTNQTVTIVGSLVGGAGVIDMSANSLPHVLNLAGATNTIGTFTSGVGSSTVNYNGIVPTQTVFPALNYRNLTISNSGVKILQGNSQVAIDLNISGGTFDLGTTTTTLPVFGNTSINGSLRFNNTATKIVSITGSLNGTGTIDMSGGNLSHFLNLTGATNSIGSYSSGSGSTVNYLRNADQTVFTSDDYRNLIISGSGIKTIYDDITAKGILTMSAGDINSNGNTLKVTNPDIGAIDRTSGKVIGKLQRAIGISGSEYLYPLGPATAGYNPMKMTFQNLTSGPLTAEFKSEDIGTEGLPLDDDGNEIYDRLTTGYWSLSSEAPMSTGSFKVNVNYDGFLGVDLSSSIIKRTNGGDLELDGEHGTITGSEITRTILINGISTTTDFGIGRGRPRIRQQPENIDICEGSDAFFEVDARGRGTLTYQWQIYNGTTYVNIYDGGVYSGTDTEKLIITAAPYSMNGSLYRVMIFDGQMNPKISETALLTVNLIPSAVATPTSQDECPGIPFTTISLTSLSLTTGGSVPGTTFAWSRTNPAGITTALPMSGSASGDQITGTFSNNTDAPIMVTFTIIPTGPATTFCVGNPITVTVTVNPTPKVLIQPFTSYTQCDSTTTSIRLTSPSTFTSGDVTFKYTVSSTGTVTGYSNPKSGMPNDHYITDQLVNQTDTFRVVTYRVVPVSPVGCADGPYQNVSVTVNPTPRVIPKNPVYFKPDSSICFGGSTEITLTTPTVMTSGVIRFDYTISATGGPGIVSGNMASATDRSPGDKIIFPYENSSDTLQSVYFSIRPKVVGLTCNAGNINKAEIRVHPHPLQQLLMPKTLTCEGGSDATLTAVLSKGAAPFNVDWGGPLGYDSVYTTSEGSTDIINLKAGIYNVTITDNLGCSNSDYESVSGARLNSRLYINRKSNGFGTTCPEPDANDGEIWIQETDNSTGIPPYTYDIVYNNADTVISNILNATEVWHEYENLPAGNYKLYIKDANGCLNTDFPERNIVAPDVITVEFKAFEYDGGYNIKCRNNSDGSVEVKTISGGNGGYTYQWQAASGVPLTVSTTTSLLDSVPAGKYYLITTDMLGCIKTDSVTLTEPEGLELVSSELSLSPDGNTNISCSGGNDGSIQLTITGGSGVYNYLWTDSVTNEVVATTEDIYNLEAGTYISTITDENQCDLKLMPGSLLPTFTLRDPSPLSVTPSISVSTDGSYNINCNGGTGSVNIIVTGGSPDSYIYNWSTTDGSGMVDGQKDQSALTNGTYHLVVKDLNNCEESIDVTLSQPAPLVQSIIANDITCQSPGFNNGSIDLTISGGVAPYNYSWSNGDTTEDISGLTEGYYDIIITDANGCSILKDSIEISKPPPLTYTSDLSDFNGYNVSCYGSSNGNIQIDLTSGLAPYSYSWTGPDGFSSTTEDISDLRAGQYTLLITDDNFCTATEVINLKEPGKLGMAISLSESYAGGFNINCAGDSTGYIGIEPLNQVNAVDYLWSDGIFGKTRMNLPAGDYTVILTDANNCYASSTITLTEPDSMKLAFDISQPFCPDMPNGEIRTNVSGGVMGTDYSYVWSDNSTGNDISDILKGFYKVVVTDRNGCILRDSVIIEPLNESCLIIPNAISPNGDLINDVWNIGMIELYPSMEIRIFNRWGKTIWRSEKGYPNPWDGRSNGSSLPIDSYHYIIDLHNGTKPIVGNVTIVR